MAVTDTDTAAPDDLAAHKAATEELPGAGLDYDKMPGHWLLAQMGKRVLRPGGIALTNAMLNGLRINSSDEVVELAPGLGATTRLALQNNPASYIGIERDETAAAQVGTFLNSPTRRCEVGLATATGLPDESATVVFGEAYLTMQSNEHKRAIAEEIYRVLKPGGRVGMHELSFRPAAVPEERQKELRGELSRTIHVGARPITVASWKEVFESVGFDVVEQHDAPMGLLHPRRLIADEGLLRALKIAFNIARNPKARRRVLGMRQVFQDNADNLGSIALIAVKPR